MPNNMVGGGGAELCCLLFICASSLSARPSSMLTFPAPSSSPFVFPSHSDAPHRTESVAPPSFLRPARDGYVGPLPPHHTPLWSSSSSYPPSLPPSLSTPLWSPFPLDPSLPLSLPPSGKTSTILACAKQMYGTTNYGAMTLELNASDERGIDVVRQQIKEFAGTKRLFRYLPPSLPPSLPLSPPPTLDLRGRNYVRALPPSLPPSLPPQQRCQARHPRRS